jgi:hypothetical protein
MAQEPKPAKAVTRKERLAAELRANLRKRKTQARARAEAAGESTGDEPALRQQAPSAKP